MAGHAGADHLGVVGLPGLDARLELHSVVAVHAIVCGADMRAILAKHRARGDRMRAIVAGITGADDLGVIHCQGWLEVLVAGVVAVFANGSCLHMLGVFAEHRACRD